MKLYQELDENSQRYVDAMYERGYSCFADLLFAEFITEDEFIEAMHMITDANGSPTKHKQLYEFRQMLAALYLTVSDEL